MFFNKIVINTRSNLNSKVFSKPNIIKGLLIFLTCLILGQTKALSTQQENKQFTIGLLQIIEHPALNKTQKGIIDGLKKTFPNIKITVKIAQNNIINATMISQKFVSDNVDVIVVLGTAAAQVTAKAAMANKTPVIFASITDPIEAKLVKDLDKPGGNTTGVSNYTPQTPQLIYFKTLIPDLKTIGFIYNPGEVNSVTLLNRTKKAAKQLGLKIISAAVTKTTEVSMATHKLVANKIGAIFINNDNTALSAFDVIAQICNQTKTPLFVSDTDMVKQGALASLGPDQYNLGLQCAEIIITVLKGGKTQDIPVQFPKKTEKYLNLKVAKEMGLKFSKELLNDIDVVLPEQ